MAKYRRKKSWKSIICAVLIVTLVASLGGVIISFAAKDSKTIPSSVFSVGGLDENGKYMADDKSIYTKEVFECIGLRVQPDFESLVTYDVYYYDYDERLVEAKTGLTEVYDEDFPLAQYCRIVIHPEIPEDVEKSEFKIKWYQVNKYANELKITVDKKQEYLYSNCVNLYNDENATKGSGFTSALGGKFAITEIESVKCSEKITVDPSWNFVDVYVRNINVKNVNSQAVVITDADNIVVATGGLSVDDFNYNVGEWVKFTVEIPEDYEGLSLYVRMYQDCECYVFGY